MKGFPGFTVATATVTVAATVMVLLVLTGCASNQPANQPANQRADQPAGRAANQPANQSVKQQADPPPVPVLKVGEPFSADLQGDGQATITVAEAVLSKLDGVSDRLVVTVDIRLNKAGKPITGGPENFHLRDKDSTMHKAQIDEQAFPPRLPSVSFTTAGQSAHGRLYFDVPAGNTEGGVIQLMTGVIVHAVWTL